MMRRFSGALLCYDCTSTVHPGCNDEFEKGRFSPINNCAQCLKSKVEGTDHVERHCSPVKIEDGSKCTQMKLSDKTTAMACFCDKDLCNGSDAIFAGIVLTAFVLCLETMFVYG
ncbi:hypothetical protein DPMN_189852 [Dreissena polymorpha]|uniref:Protein sleepless n=1 Tax=Dreissena polymorpha TaxID=45954 RepID=A0A9D4DVM6_DREPO|nr:hypothetical protein DPMN_189852 [Dreissena polymorpha]